MSLVDILIGIKTLSESVNDNVCERVKYRSIIGVLMWVKYYRRLAENFYAHTEFEQVWAMSQFIFFSVFVGAVAYSEIFGHWP
jgi:hypothetical protein